MFVRRIRRRFSEIFKGRQTPPPPPPWYTGPPTFPARRSFAPPPEQTSTASTTPDWAKITQVTRQHESALQDTQRVLSDTQPIKRPEQDDEDTRQTQAVRPPVTPPVRGPYDDLFPPPQPGDEDYLEADTSIGPIPEDEPPANQASTGETSSDDRLSP